MDHTTTYFVETMNTDLVTACSRSTPETDYTSRHKRFKRTKLTSPYPLTQFCSNFQDIFILLPVSIWAYFKALKTHYNRRKEK